MTPNHTDPHNTEKLREAVLRVLLDEIQSEKHVKNYPYRLPVLGKPKAADKIVELFTSHHQATLTGADTQDTEDAQSTHTTKPLTFVVYRTEAKALKPDIEGDNYLDSDQVQFEGVEFWDGTVAIRWRTPTTSMSFWESMEALKKVHIYAHPNYGTRVEWSNGKVEQL